MLQRVFRSKNNSKYSVPLFCHRVKLVVGFCVKFPYLWNPLNSLSLNQSISLPFSVCVHVHVVLCMLVSVHMHACTCV